jgi:uncharacterized protein DUF4845
MKSQRGVTLVGLLVAGIVVVFVAIGGLKIAPAYIEYYKVKKAVAGIAQANRGDSVPNVRRAFDLRSAVDDIDVISGKDLDITKEGNDLVVSFSYSKRVALFGNISIVFDFAASSNQ